MCRRYSSLHCEFDYDGAMHGVADQTPPSVPGLLDVMARRGYFRPEILEALPDEDAEAVSQFVRECMAGVTEQVNEAVATGNEVDRSILLETICFWANRTFDMEVGAALDRLSEEEHESFRQKPVNQETWRQLQASAWQRPLRPCYRAPERMRGGQHRRHVRRRRRVASSPRRARAPARSGDGPEPAHDVDRRDAEVAL